MKRKNKETEAYEWMMKYATRDQLATLFPSRPKNRQSFLKQLNAEKVMKSPLFLQKVTTWQEEYRETRSHQVEWKRRYFQQKLAWKMLAEEIYLNQTIELACLPYAFSEIPGYAHYSNHRKKWVKAQIVTYGFPEPKTTYAVSWLISVRLMHSVQVEGITSSCTLLKGTLLSMWATIHLKCINPKYEWIALWEEGKTGMKSNVRIIWDAWKMYVCVCLEKHILKDLVALIMPFLKTDEQWTEQ